jgi:hypothetical protein
MFYLRCLTDQGFRTRVNLLAADSRLEGPLLCILRFEDMSGPSEVGLELLLLSSEWGLTEVVSWSSSRKRSGWTALPIHPHKSFAPTALSRAGGSFRGTDIT